MIRDRAVPFGKSIILLGDLNPIKGLSGELLELEQAFETLSSMVHRKKILLKPNPPTLEPTPDPNSLQFSSSYTIMN